MGSVYRCENPRSLGRRECQPSIIMIVLVKQVSLSILWDGNYFMVSVKHLSNNICY